MIYKIKDSVDLYLSENTLTAYFLSSRLQKNYKVNKKSLKVLQLLDGKKDLNEIAIETGFDFETLKKLIIFLSKQNIISKVHKSNNYLTEIEHERYQRQLNYLSEFLDSDKDAEKAQYNLKNTKFLIFGCGSIGGNIAIQLAMAGAIHFQLYDAGIVRESDIGRHIYYNHEDLNCPKVESLKKYLIEINSDVKIKVHHQYMNPDTDISSIIISSDFVINTLDEPYIGYTSTKISRLCTPLKIPHFIAGGFDAHLASTGELIIPGVTPCVECYAVHFEAALKGWQPNPHPVKINNDEVGGLSSMSLFSSSYASLEIIKYITNFVNQEKSFKTRGELLFDTLDINYIDLIKNPSCKVCGNLEES